MLRITVLLLLALCLVFADRAHAQRQLPGMRGIQLTGGMTDGLYSSALDNEGGYYFGVAMATYAKRGNKWVFGAEFMERYNPYRAAIRIPVSQFTAEGGYYLKIVSDPSKTFLLSLGVSGLAGYETVNWGEKSLYDGSTLRDEDGFIGGGAMTLEMETYLTDKIVLLLTGRERVLWGNSTGHFHLQFGVGIKFIIN